MEKAETVVFCNVVFLRTFISNGEVAGSGNSLKVTPIVLEEDLNVGSSKTASQEPSYHVHLPIYNLQLINELNILLLALSNRWSS